MIADAFRRMTPLLIIVGLSCSDAGREVRSASPTVPNRASEGSVKDSKNSIVHLTVAPNGGGKATARNLDELPESERDRVKQLLNDPRLKAAKMRMQDALKRGPLALVLVDRPLARGVVTEVHLNAKGSLPRFFVVEKSALDDEIIDRAMSLALRYEMQYPDDHGAVEFTLFASGNYVRESATNGRFEGHQFFEGFYTQRDRKSAYLLQAAEQVGESDVAKVGRARVVSLGEP